MRLTVRISELDRPRMFADVMVEGPFRSMRHVHRFVTLPTGMLVTPTGALSSRRPMRLHFIGASRPTCFSAGLPRERSPIGRERLLIDRGERSWIRRCRIARHEPAGRTVIRHGASWRKARIGSEDLPWRRRIWRRCRRKCSAWRGVGRRRAVWHAEGIGGQTNRRRREHAWRRRGRYWRRGDNRRRFDRRGGGNYAAGSTQLLGAPQNLFRGDLDQRLHLEIVSPLVANFAWPNILAEKIDPRPFVARGGHRLINRQRFKTFLHQPDFASAVVDVIGRYRGGANFIIVNVNQRTGRVAANGHAPLHATCKVRYQRR